MFSLISMMLGLKAQLSKDRGPDLSAGRLAGPPVHQKRSSRMRNTVVLAVLAVIVLIIAVQFGPSLVSH
jgi:hypothetical protein